MAEKDRPLPKFGEWDVNDPASAEGFTVIFNKARDEKKTGGQPGSPPKDDSKYKHREVLGKPHSCKEMWVALVHLQSHYCHNWG
ncbi:protein NOI4 isoform X3 [Quercus robur]|uniref:protein NOI4 isoform X3 n=1 Tax=Quercus lobata TaxID=97700 RepID=UPI001247FDA0|nr:protein NOI4 isoform X3 [Quercus lobata]XP_050279821.1 protein NOI4 isoform X3 [Quercus robur]